MPGILQVIFFPMSLPVNFMTMTIFALDVSMARTQTKWKQEVWVLYVDTTWKYYSWTAGRHCVYNYKNLLCCSIPRCTEQVIDRWIETSKKIKCWRVSMLYFGHLVMQYYIKYPIEWNRKWKISVRTLRLRRQRTSLCFVLHERTLSLKLKAFEWILVKLISVKVIKLLIGFKSNETYTWAFFSEVWRDSRSNQKRTDGGMGLWTTQPSLRYLFRNVCKINSLKVTLAIHIFSYTEINSSLWPCNMALYDHIT